MTKRPTVLEACIASLGVHRGAIAASYVSRYALTQVRIGHFPTAVEYANDWAIDERTAWRHRARMQDALGDRWEAAVEAVASRVDAKASVGSAIRTGRLVTV